jgi:hypothetical protein
VAGVAEPIIHTRGTVSVTSALDHTVALQLQELRTQDLLGHSGKGIAGLGETGGTRTINAR